MSAKAAPIVSTRDGRFVAGQSDNPKGRAVGSRNKLGEEFLSAFQADFTKHVVAVIEKFREDKPNVSLKVIASLSPRDVNINADPLEAMSDDELATDAEKCLAELTTQRFNCDDLSLVDFQAFRAELEAKHEKTMAKLRAILAQDED